MRQGEPTHPADLTYAEMAAREWERRTGRVRHPDLNRWGGEVVEVGVVDPVREVEMALRRRGDASRESRAAEVERWRGR
jgi:hypothetical protein